MRTAVSMPPISRLIIDEIRTGPDCAPQGRRVAERGAQIQNERSARARARLGSTRVADAKRAFACGDALPAQPARSRALGDAAPPPRAPARPPARSPHQTQSL